MLHFTHSLALLRSFARLLAHSLFSLQAPGVGVLFHGMNASISKFQPIVCIVFVMSSFLPFDQRIHGVDRLLHGFLDERRDFRNSELLRCFAR